MHGFDVEAGDQHHHVGHVLRNAVTGRVAQPIATPAPDNIGADDAMAAGHRTRKVVKIMPVARQTVDANQYLRIGRITPFGLGHAMQARRRGALDAALARFMPCILRIHLASLFRRDDAAPLTQQ